MHQHTKDITYRGLPLAEAKKAMIMIHGRGATPESVLGLATYLELDDFALLAPRATQGTWYPYSFMAPVSQNEPSLSSALSVLDGVVTEIRAADIADEHIYFLGFSQGACLASEYVAQKGQKYGGLFVYSGGLIGAELDTSKYKGDFSGMPVLLGCSDTDAHIPLARVKETAAYFQEVGAEVTERIYPNGAHTVFEDEIEQTNAILAKARTQ
ncbi:MAG TPA: dienelactone hydrolase family protein [Saprospiraceae bacterium]|nr:dienelactone hydrolase family protein [Saprospiraceae bacterium]